MISISAIPRMLMWNAPGPIHAFTELMFVITKLLNTQHTHATLITVWGLERSRYFHKISCDRLKKLIGEDIHKIKINIYISLLQLSRGSIYMFTPQKSERRVVPVFISLTSITKCTCKYCWCKTS